MSPVKYKFNNVKIESKEWVKVRIVVCRLVTMLTSCLVGTRT